MKLAAIALLVLFAACKEKPGPGELTGTISPEAEARRATETPASTPSDTALTGTFGGTAPASTSAPTATSGTHPGATGTDASSTTDPNVTTTNAPPNRTAT